MGRSKRAALVVAVTGAALIPAATATDYIWTRTAGGTAYNWNNAGGQNNWGPGAYPNALSDTANLSANDIVGDQTITLPSAVTLGSLFLGDAGVGGSGSATGNNFTLSGSAPLTFRNAAGLPSAISLPNVYGSTSTNTVGVGVVLASPLVITNPGAQTLTFTGGISGNGNALTFNNAGPVIVDTLPITGTGSAVTKNGSGTLTLLRNQTFTGGMVINDGQANLHAGAAILSGLSDSAGLVLNSNANISLGSNSFTSAAGGRIPDSARVTFNAGHLRFNGASNGAYIGETIGTASFASGSAAITVSRQDNYPISRLTFNNVVRSTGATVQLRAQDKLGPNGGNYEQYLYLSSGLTLIGGTGAAGSTTMPIVPWMLAGNIPSGSQPRDFVTYEAATGARPLASSEYEIRPPSNWGSTSNVNVLLATTLTQNRAINSLALNASSLNLAGQLLTVRSGALSLTNNSNLSNGTLSFANAGNNPIEGIIWVTNTDTATLSANINTASALTKGSTGTLILSGNNTYTGPTYIGGGAIRAAAANTIPSQSAVVLANTTVNNLAGTIGAVGTIFDLNGFNQSIGSLAGGGDLGGKVMLGSATLTTGNDGTSTTYAGTITGPGSLVKVGAGTLTLAGNNTYTGVTKVSAGRLRLGSNEVIADTSNIELAGGTLDLAGFNETLGTLALSATSSIDFGTGNNTLTFADSHSTNWAAGAALTIYNWDGADSLSFSATATGLSGTQVSQILFVDPAGDPDPALGTTYFSTMLSTGQIVAAIPEPTSLAIVSIAALMLRRRRCGETASTRLE